MRLFKSRWFARYARRERIRDASLVEAIGRAQKGLIDADLGGHIIKQRVAREGRGRSGGYRVIIAFHAGRRAFFVYCFAKSERGNIDADELETLRKIAADLLKADAAAIARELELGNLVEIGHEVSKEES